MTEAVVSPIREPDAELMRQHLLHLFGGDLDGCHDGLIEIAWTRPTPDEKGRHSLDGASLFGVDQIDAAVAEAVKRNRVQGQNVYVGAALRLPDTPPFGRTDDADFYAATCVWCDLDDEEAARAARLRYKDAPPTLVIVTGRVPGLRAQAWWRLETPERDPEKARARNSALVHALGGDPTVVNPGRVMRLGGSVAWPTKPGRVMEVTEIKEPSGARPQLYVDTIFDAAYAPQERRQAGKIERKVETTQTAPNGLGIAEERIADGRESYMRDTILAVFVEWCGTNGCEPTAQELYDAAWAQYEAHVDLSRPGRGPDEFEEKVEYLLRRFREGRLPGLKTLDDAVASYQAKQRPPSGARVQEEAQARTADAAEPYEFPRLKDWTADRYAGAAPPIEWLCEGTIPLGVPVLLAAMGGIGKSFLMLDAALAIACGVTSVAPKIMLGGPIVAHGSAVIISGEDSHASIHRRLAAIDPYSRRAVTEGRLMVVPMPDAGGPRAIISETRDGLVATAYYADLKRQLIEIPNLRLVVIDPLQAFALADINADPAAGQFFWSCLAEVCALTGATVVVCHHMRKDGSSRIRTADDAREAIRGSTALVDGARASYALWKEHDEESRQICGALDIPFQPGRIVRGAVVKVNDQADQSVHTYIRADTGLLMDRSSEIPSLDHASPALRDEQIVALLQDIDRRWKAKAPLKVAVNSNNPAWVVVKNLTGLSPQDAKQLVRDWVANEVVVEDVYDSRNHRPGLRVGRWIRGGPA
jgi:hypothetical protein